MWNMFLRIFRGEEISSESIDDYLIIDEEIENPEEETLERNAYVDSGTKFDYTLSGNEAVITGYNGNSTSINIPSYVGGYKVTSIRSYAFEDSTMTSLTIPSTITSIGYGAFYNCQKLSSITFNATNCNDCSRYSTFYNAGHESSALNVTFGNGVKKIQAYLFYTGENYYYGDGYYAHITSVTIPSSVQEICSSSFGNCYD